MLKQKRPKRCLFLVLFLVVCFFFPAHLIRPSSSSYRWRVSLSFQLPYSRKTSSLSHRTVDVDIVRPESWKRSCPSQTKPNGHNPAPHAMDGKSHTSSRSSSNPNVPERVVLVQNVRPATFRQRRKPLADEILSLQPLLIVVPSTLRRLSNSASSKTTIVMSHFSSTQTTFYSRRWSKRARWLRSRVARTVRAKRPC